MVPSAAAQQLSELIDHQATILGHAQASLAAAVKPLVGKPNQPVTRSLTYAEAGRLDAALGMLLATSTKDGPGYEEEIDAVRDLL